jgi:cytoskeleton protein RodZ
MEKLSRLLRQERERRDISLQEAQRKTRIPLHYLEMLEGTGERRFLADSMYLIPSLRTYATFLGINPATAMTQFMAELQESQEHTVQAPGFQPPPHLFKHQPQRSRFLFRTIVLLFVLGTLAFIGQYDGIETRWRLSGTGKFSSPPAFSDPPSTAESSLPPLVSSPLLSVPPVEPQQSGPSPARLAALSPLDTARQAESLEVSTPRLDSTLVDFSAQSQEPATDPPHLLRVQAKEEVWLRVTIEGQSTKDVFLQPGQAAEWSAQTGFILTLGNAGGVELTLDGQGLPPLGKSGQVIRNLRLPSQG